MTRRRFWDSLIKIPDAITGKLITPRPHHAQAEVMRDLDAIDPATGLRLYPIHFWHWARKCAKDFMLSVEILYHLGFDPFEKEPRFAAVAAWDSQQTQITKRTTEQLIQRASWLRGHYKIYKDTIVFAEKVRDTRTGGSYVVEHIADFLSRDIRRPWLAPQPENSQ